MRDPLDRKKQRPPLPMDLGIIGHRVNLDPGAESAPRTGGSAMGRKFSHLKGGTSRTADRELSGRPIAIELGLAWGAIKTALAAPRRPLAHPQAA